MKKIAIVTDSTTYFTDEQYKEFGIKRISLNIVEGDTSFRELEIDNSFVYEQFDQGKRLTTSQPSPGEFLNAYQDLFKEGYEKILVLVISGPLSGTHQSAKIALNMLDNPEDVYLFDSNMAAFGNEMLLLKVIDYVNEGKDEAFIIEKINSFIKTTGLIIVTEDLISLIRSGRLSKAQGFIGKVLRIKPVVRMREGKLDLLTKVRKKSEALDAVLDYMKEHITDNYNKLYVRVCSHNSLEQAKIIMDFVKENYKNVELTFSEYIGPVFNVHVGPTGFGLSWMTE